MLLELLLELPLELLLELLLEGSFCEGRRNAVMGVKPIETGAFFPFGFSTGARAKRSARRSHMSSIPGAFETPEMSAYPASSFAGDALERSAGLGEQPEGYPTVRSLTWGDCAAKNANANLEISSELQPHQLPQIVAYEPVWVQLMG